MTVLLLLSAGVVPATYGLWTTYGYFRPQGYSSHMGFKGFAAGWANWWEVKDVSVNVAILIPTKDVQLIFQFFGGKNRTNEFVFIFPFPVQSVQNPAVYMGNGSATTSAMNISTSSQVEVITHQKLANETEQVVLLMRATGDLLTGSRGNYVFSFPSGIYPRPDVTSSADYINANQQSQVEMQSPQEYSFSVELGLSKDSVVTSVFPLNYKPYPTNYTFADNIAGKGPTEWLDWDFSGTSGTPISVQFQSPSEVGTYEESAYWGGVLIAIGFSTIIAMAVQYLDPRRR